MAITLPCWEEKGPPRLELAEADLCGSCRLFQVSSQSTGPSFNIYSCKKMSYKEPVQVTFPPPKENSRLTAHHCHFTNVGQLHRLCSLLREEFYSGPQHSQTGF